MDSNSIYHPSPANKMKYSFLDYVQLLMISWTDRWTQTVFTTPLQPIKWSAHFFIMFKFWWSAGLVDGLEPHLPLFSSKKNEMLIFGLHSTSDDQLGWSVDSNPIHHPSSAKKMKCSFFDYVQLLMISWAGRWTQISSPSLSSQNSEMLIFVLHSTSDVGQTGQWTWTPSTTSVQPKDEMLIFGLCSSFDDYSGCSMNSNPILHPSPANKIKCSFLDYVQLLMISRACQWTWTPSTTCLQAKK